MTTEEIIKQAEERGHKDALAGYDKGDLADWADLEDALAEATGFEQLASEAMIQRQLEIGREIGGAYWRGYRRGFEERGGGRALTDLAAAMQMPYDTLVKAAREGRLRAWKSGGTWLSSLEAIREAKEAKRIR